MGGGPTQGEIEKHLIRENATTVEAENINGSQAHLSIHIQRARNV